MFKTRPNMAKVSLICKCLFATAESFSLLCSEQIGNNKKKHKIPINKQSTQTVFFCKILKSLFHQNTLLLHMEWNSMRLF